MAHRQTSHQRILSIHINCKRGQRNMNSTRCVRTAEFPPDDASPSDIHDRRCLHGGAVTAATVRFPPPRCMHGEGDAAAEPKYQYDASRGRVVFARGPWIESRPLFPDNDANSCGSEPGQVAKQSLDESNASCSRDVAVNFSNDNKTCYRILAFGDEKHGSSTIEAVSGMVFPSSSSSLPSLGWTSSDDTEAVRERKHEASSLISVVAFGGRRISFLTGGGLWNDLFDASGGNDGTASQSAGDFAHLPILRRDVQCSYLEVSDWIHDARLLDVEPKGSREVCDGRIGAFLVAMGTVNNNCDIWGFCLQADEDRKGLALSPTRLQCITTVRLWAPLFDCKIRRPRDILALESEWSREYTLVWTGWGHAARVWDVSFVGQSRPILVSVGEDGVARIWNPAKTKKEVAHPLRGHRCESVWTVDICEGVIVTGGNDGCVKLFDLESRMQTERSKRPFAVPKDPHGLPDLEATGTDRQTVAGDEAKTSANTQSRKKQKRKAKSKGGQAICGMEFYGSKGKVHDSLLVAVRAGGLFSLDLLEDEWTDFGRWSVDVMSAFNGEDAVNVDPSTGNCLGVSPNGRFAVIGTTEGWLIMQSLSRPNALNGRRKCAFHAASHRPAQSMSFIDDSNLLVFYARAVVWFTLDGHPVPLHVMTLGTAGIPLSFAHSGVEQALYIGDTRGNISCYDLSQSIEVGSNGVCEQEPASVLAKAHAKEHVTGLAVLKSGVVVSVGNDGCLHQCRRDANGQLTKLLSLPVPNVTGLKHVWSVRQANGEESVVLGGYYGNDFVMLDAVNGYEFLRVAAGGRQRRQDFFFCFSTRAASIRCPSIFAVAVLTGLKDGYSMIDIHYSEGFEQTLARGLSQRTRNAIQSTYNIGSPAHSETINDACWFKSRESTYLLTGSNDCAVRLSRLVNNNLVAVMELPPHESCVRGVCASSHPQSDASLLVTCGGKLGMEFYVLDQTGSGGVCVASLCSYRTLEKATIDHRMNAVRAMPLDAHEERCHLVLAGDSDGNLHLIIVSERATARRTTIGTILKGMGRPVLCLELIGCGDKILAFVGTTGGKIAAWVFPSRVSQNNSDTEAHCLEGPLPEAALHVFKAHQSGVNDLSVATDISEGGYSVILCSVGDDQTLSTCRLSFTGECHLEQTHLSVTTCASASALKAVQLISDGDGSSRIYTAGQDERITLWKLDANSVKVVSSSPLGTEGSCLDCVRLHQPDGSTEEVVAAGGDGIELQSLNLNILRAAKKLREANYLLITTGAGFSADSGLSTYECAPAEYRDMCNPAKLTDDPLRFQQFWLNFTRSYLETKPHKGYDILDQWCRGGRLPQLKSPLDQRPWWVYSSNVDDHFRLFQSFESSLCAIHGSALEFRCACGIGYSGEEPRLGKDWDEWNEKMRPTNLCKGLATKMDLALLESTASSDEVLQCQHCSQPMRPNVLMFNDTDENVLTPIGIQRERYQHWEALVEDDVALNGAKLVILEMGCGVNVPAVRQESEEVLLDCAKKLQSKGGEGKGSVCLIRVNPKEAQINVGGEETAETISITSTAAIALCKIDSWLKALDG
ncbi:hypothetical protein ACHAXT_007028 [Thalassiosira profunda]